jgi:hypothetical protein
VVGLFLEREIKWCGNNREQDALVAGDESIAVLPEAGIFGEISSSMETIDLCADLLKVCQEGGGGFYRIWIARHGALAVEILLLQSGLYLVADGLLLCAEVLKLCLDAGADVGVY